jgi:GAF domain-containing protein
MDFRKLVSELAQGAITLEDAHKQMCKAITETVGSTRASVWIFNELGTAMTCAMLYDTRTSEFVKDIVLKEDDFPEYFDAIRQDLWVNAPDAEDHPATKCFTEDYFMPLDIRSLLDFVILVGGSPKGVLCCEHCGNTREWTKGDEQYLQTMAQALAVTFRLK